MTVQIRLALPGDEKTLAKLCACIQRLHIAQHPSHFKPFDLSEVTDWFASQFQDPTMKSWIAEHNGDPVGYIAAFLKERPENPFCHTRKWLEIAHIYVVPEHQRNGIARRLIEHALELANDEHIRDVELSTWCFNDTALQAFQKIGFAPQYVQFKHGSPQGTAYCLTLDEDDGSSD